MMDKSKLSVKSSEELIRVEEAKKQSTNTVGNRASVANTISQHDNVELVADIFGSYHDDNGVSHNIQRFTWKNKNKIQIQVINYGARITSIKMPDRKGSVDDIVLGFDDLAGYIYYKNKYFGATIGRMTNYVKNSTFYINNTQYSLTSNKKTHHYNGGKVGFDQVVWTTYVDDKKVIMSHVSPHMTEGYPGDLLTRIIFELSARNEFTIRMEAQCTKPTILNLSNMTYFNLAGHNHGPTETYKHILTMNCNCFTPQVDGLPTGGIMNVIHSGFDFQIPKTLGKLIGILPKDGYNQNLCINRGMNQDDCFVARVLHPPSGRLVEMYSNQWGVNLSTCNDFGFGTVMSTEQLLKSATAHKITKCEGPEPLLRLYEKVHQEIKSTLSKDEPNTFKGIYDLIKKIKEIDSGNVPNNTPAEPVDDNVPEEDCHGPYGFDFWFTQIQMEYLNNLFKILCDDCDEELCEELKEIVKTILSLAKVRDESDGKKDEKGEDVDETDKKDNGEQKTKNGETTTKKKSEINKKYSSRHNTIPDYYRNTNKIIGKDRAQYVTHGGIALQTQNYPGCANFKNFPSCILKPGETYVHTITYKFWIRAGSPNKWIKRNARMT